MKIFVSIALTLLACPAFAAVPQNPKVSAPPMGIKNFSDSSQSASGPQKQKIVASASKALSLARTSRQEKNYILALKRYNFILKYYSKTPYAKVALADKSSMYKEMGLNAQADYNQKKVLSADVKPIKKSATIKR